MPVYEYVAVDAAGKTRKGITDADSIPTARQKVRSMGLYPSSITEAKSGRVKAGKASPRFVRGAKGAKGARHASPLTRIFQRVSRADLAASTRQIATLLNAGLPLDTVLAGVIEGRKDTPLNRTIAQVRERVKEGASLAAALEEHPHVFNTTYVTMVRAGESSGTLELVMDRLADFAEQQLALTRKLQSTLAYPVLMITVGIGVVIFLMAFVVPKVAEIFTNVDQALPPPTLVLIAISDVVSRFWYLIPALLILMWIGLKAFMRRPRGRMFVDTRLLALPIIGPIINKIAVARFARTLGTLVKNGVPLLKAMDIVRNVVSNVVVRKAIEESSQDVSEGGGLSRPLSRHKLFPAAVIQMVSAGEQSGELDTMLLKVAEMSEAEVSTRLTVLTSLMEPIMILVLGALVGFVVLAVLLPIFEMSSLIH